MNTQTSENGAPSLARSALAASGFEGKRAEEYLRKLDRLAGELRPLTAGRSDREAALALFRRLCELKPGRYQYHGRFQLHEVLDAQLDPAVEKVGNCLGLTLLYNSLARALGLRVGAIHLEEAFGRGPHVLSLLHDGAATVDIENIRPDGFDFREHLGSPGRDMWDDDALAADLHHSLGNVAFEAGEIEDALRQYQRAVSLNPRYAKAYWNKGIALARLGRLKEAEAVFRKTPAARYAGRPRDR